MWIMPSHARPNNARRFFDAYRRTQGSTPGIVVIDDTDPKRSEYESIEYPEGWSLKVYPEMTMVKRLNRAFDDNPGLDWYGGIDDDSVPTTREWDKRLVEAAGKNKIAYCYNGISNENLICQNVMGKDVARKIGWMLLPETDRIYGDNALTDMAVKLDCAVYLPDVRLEQYHFSNGRAPMDETYKKPSAKRDKKAYIDWYWKNFLPPVKPLGDELIVCCVMVGNYLGRGAEYVNILADAVNENMTVPHRFICFCDKPDGIKCETQPIYGEGWFSKLYLFEKFSQGRVIFLDLDTVIAGNLDYLAAYQGEFAMLRDFYRPDGFGSGVMLWRGGFGHEISKDWHESIETDVEGGDQAILEKKNPEALQDLFRGIISYKEGEINNDTSLICFHGNPKPHDCDNDFIGNLWRIKGEAEATVAGMAYVYMNGFNNIKSLDISVNGKHFDFYHWAELQLEQFSKIEIEFEKQGIKIEIRNG